MHTLREIYYAEKQIAEALTEMIDKATSARAEKCFREPSCSDARPN
ncbi:DUF892 family protein [Nordella sp. HKS 07]|nr:DUF892 family protein [Nordella sp. HKS 07]